MYSTRLFNLLVISALSIQLQLVGCSDQTVTPPGAKSEQGVSLQMPNFFRESRIEQEDLELVLSVNGEVVPMTNDGTQWTGVAVVDFGQQLDLAIEWSTDSIELAALKRTIPSVVTNLDLRYSDDDYELIDYDGDDVPNLTELDASTDINDPNSYPDVEGIRYLGFVDVEESLELNLVDVFAQFERYPKDVLASVFESLYILPERDRCVVNTSLVEFPNLTATYIEAGDVLTLTSDAGTYLQMSKSGIENFIEYYGEVSGRIPSTLILDIPGGEFPSFSNIELPAVNSLELISLTPNELITADTQFNWVASGRPNTFVQIYFSGMSSVGERLFGICFVLDDGNFSFPDEIRTQMGANYASDFGDFYRGAVNVQRRDNALLIMTVGTLVELQTEDDIVEPIFPPEPTPAEPN